MGAISSRLGAAVACVTAALLAMACAAGAQASITIGQVDPREPISVCVQVQLRGPRRSVSR